MNNENKQTQTQQEDEKGFLDNVEVLVTKIECKERYGEDIIEKVTIETDQGNITWKPKIITEHFRQGIVILKPKQGSVADMPEFLLNLGKELQIKGSVRVRASYQYWTTTKGDQRVTYKYLQGSDPFKSWEIKQ